MFFNRRKSRARGYTRYGRSPLLTNTPAARNRKRNTIPNLSLPSLTTIKRILLGMTAVVLLGAGVYFFAFSSYFKILKIHVQYDEFQNENTDILSYFDAAKGKNILTVETGGIIEQIKSENPELQQVTVKKILPSTLQIHFSEYPIIANIEKVINGKTVKKVLVNAIGIAVYGDTENPNLPYIKVISKKEPSVEEEIRAIETTAENPSNSEIPNSDPSTSDTQDQEARAETETTAPVTTITEEDASIPILSQENLTYILKAGAYYEEKFGMHILETQFLLEARELHLKTEKYFTLWLDTQIPFERQFLKLKKAMATLDIYKTPLEYIDLRITGTTGEKVIFKRKK